MARNRNLERRKRIRRRIRKKVSGTASRPRLSIFKSSKHIYAQMIDDGAGHTLVSVSSLGDASLTGSPVEKSAAVGKKLAAFAKEAGIENAVFDRNGYKYHGRVKALADGIREGGVRI